MWRFLLRIAFVFILIALFAQCGVSDNPPGEQAQIPETDRTLTFLGVEWSDVVFNHQQHSDRYNGECIRCHDHEPIAGKTHWYCRSCHTAGTDREKLCTPVQYHGCVMTQCHNCHEVKGANPGLTCRGCHTGGQISGVDIQAPTVPTGLTTTAVSSSQIDLSWTASTDNVGVAGYKIYRGGVYLKSVTGTSTSDTGLTASTQYCYRVSAYDAANNESAQSTEACATTQSGGGGGDTTAPTVPTGLTATAVSSSQTDLSWTASTDNVAVVGYKIYRAGVYLKAVTTGTSTTDTGLPSNTLYCYQVTAYDGANYESAQSTQACASTPVASGTQPGGTPSLVLEDSVSQPSDVDHWTLTLNTSGTIIIDVEAWESCNGSGKINIPNDFFGDGQNNNKLHANIYLFDSNGTVVASSTGTFSADSGGRYPASTPAPPGNHDTRSGQNPYINVSVPAAGTYILAIGSLNFSQTDAWAGLNTNGSDWKNSYKGTTSYNKYRIKIYFN